MRTFLLLIGLWLGASHVMAQEAQPTVVAGRGPVGVVLLWADEAATPGARYAVERQVGSAWVQVHRDPLGLPSTLEATKTLFGEGWAELLALFEAQTDEQLYQALRSFSGPAMFLALFDPEFGERVGRRFLDPSAPEGALRYRIVRDGVQRAIVGTVDVPAEAPPILPPSRVVAVLDTAAGTPVVQYELSPSQTAISYNVYRSEAGGMTFRVNPNMLIPIAENGEFDRTAVFTFRDESARFGSTYTYAMRAVDLGGNESDATEAAPITLPFPLPAQPEAFTVQRTEDGQVLLSWDPASDEGVTVAYRIRRGDSNSETLPRLAGVTLPATMTSWVDDTAPPSSILGYQVVAVGADTSRYSASAVAYVEVPSLPAQAATGLTAVAHPEGVALSWNPAEDGAMYAVTRYESPEDTLGIQLNSFSPELSRVDTLAAEVTVWYAVQVRGAAGQESPFSERVSATSGRQLSPGVAPMSVSLLESTPLMVTWEMPVGRIPDAYRVYRETELLAETSLEETMVMDSTGAAPRFYRIAALYGETEVFADTLFVPQFTNVFEMPELNLAGSQEGAVLSFFSQPGTRFLVYRWLDGQEEAQVAEVTTDEIGQAAYVDTTGQPGQIVFMRIALAQDPAQSSAVVFTRLPFADEYEDS